MLHREVRAGIWGTRLHVPWGEGFELRCNCENPNDWHVGYGLKSTDEMCNAAFVFTSADQTAKCELQTQ